jgi:hypothetical protein
MNGNGLIGVLLSFYKVGCEALLLRISQRGGQQERKIIERAEKSKLREKVGWLKK